MARVQGDADDMVGHDSFLDVVTNIVGILILLVMVVGVRSSHAVATAIGLKSSTESKQALAAKEQVEQLARTVAAEEHDIRDMVRRAVVSRDELQMREYERQLLADAVVEMDDQIAARRATLDSQQQKSFDQRRQLAEAQMKLDALTREYVALGTEQPDTEKIECEPTPIGKVVTGKEVHVLLSDDHIAMVPFDELADLVRADAEANIWRLKQQDEMERTVGPHGGFRVRYLYVKKALVVRTQNGAVMSGAIPRFSNCVFLPMTTPLGEPAEEALAPSSEFCQYLQRQRPGTTVTVWTYPGNYDRLRDVKRTIRDVGLEVAIRPLPKGMPIGASSSGSRTVSE